MWKGFQAVYQCLARIQASGHDCLVCADDPVCQLVHPVLEQSVTLQVGLHLFYFVQQLMSYLQRNERIKVLEASENRKQLNEDRNSQISNP